VAGVWDDIVVQTGVSTSWGTLTVAEAAVMKASLIVADVSVVMLKGVR
jgi:hypothetical protein